MFFGEAQEISAVLFFRVGVVDDDALALENSLFGDFIAFLFSLQCIPVDSLVFL